MVAPPPEIMEIWDRLNLRRRYVGVAGVDAHAFPVPIGPLRVEIFPYKVHFRSLRTHIILDRPFSHDFAEARDQLYDAFRRCRVFISNMRWGSADSFSFVAHSGGKEYICGDSVENGKPVTFELRLPDHAEISLIRNGEKISGKTGTNLSYETETSGLYRVEVYKGKRGWIFSNHIRVGVDG